MTGFARYTPHLLLVVLIMIWSGSFVVSKVGLATLTPFGLVTVRFWLAALCVAPFALRAGAGEHLRTALRPFLRDFGHRTLADLADSRDEVEAWFAWLATRRAGNTVRGIHGRVHGFFERLVAVQGQLEWTAKRLARDRGYARTSAVFLGIVGLLAVAIGLVVVWRLSF